MAESSNKSHFMDLIVRRLYYFSIRLDYFFVSIRPRACFSPSYNKVKSQTKHVWLLTLL